MDLSIILVSYNTKVLTLKTLETIFLSLEESPLNYEVIVVDNNSHDGSVEAIKKKFAASVQLISSPKNVGFGKANNWAFKQAKGEYILFLNSDIEVIGKAIDKLTAFFKRSHKHFQFVGGKLLNPDKTPQPSCGPFYSLWVVIAALFFKGDYWGLTRSSPNSIKKTDWVSGACFITTKRYFTDVRGFDERIFMYMEEVDFFYRAKQKGYCVGFYPHAQFIHIGSASSSSRKNPILNVYRGLLYFYDKHHGAIANSLLKLILKTKAVIGYTFGVLFNSSYLKETYGEAFRLV